MFLLDLLDGVYVRAQRRLSRCVCVRVCARAGGGVAPLMSHTLAEALVWFLRGELSIMQQICVYVQACLCVCVKAPRIKLGGVRGGGIMTFVALYIFVK